MLYNKVLQTERRKIMPPKAKYTREEIIGKAFEIAKEKGIEAVVARELGKELGTSSSPIFTAFKNMEELHTEVRKVAMKEFESYVSDALNYTPAFKYVGMKMIEFSVKEPKLFQLIYMREHAESQTYDMLVNELGDTVKVCIEIIQKDYGLNDKEARLFFDQVWLHTFGICVLTAGKICTLLPEQISEMLSMEVQGALAVIKSGNFKPTPINNINNSI